MPAYCPNPINAAPLAAALSAMWRTLFKASGGRAVILQGVAALACGFGLAPSAYAGSGAASVAEGSWEVTRVLMTGGMQTQWSMREDDPRLMGRVLHVSPQTLRFRNADTGCTAHTVAGGKAQSMRLLFAKSSPTSGKRPAAIQGSLYGRMEDYTLGAVSGRPIIFLKLDCKADASQLLADANWLAITSPQSTGATLLMPYQPDALVLLRRVPQKNSAPDAGQVAFCAQAVSASDQAICADRQLWRMHSYTLSAMSRAQSPRPELNQALEKEVAMQLQKRQDCNGDTQCLYEVLDWHIDMLVQRW
jgi:hypothetical protein